MLLSAYIVPHPPIVLPEIGQSLHKQIQATYESYEKIARQIASLSPDTIVIISSHAPAYVDTIAISSGVGASGNLARYHHPELTYDVTYDQAMIKEICALAKRNHIPAGTKKGMDASLDHGTMIPLAFLQQYINVPIVRIAISACSPKQHERLGQCITAASEELERKIVVIASGDLSHRLSKESPYGYHVQGPRFDQELLEAFAHHDMDWVLHVDESLAIDSGQCGLPTFQILCGVLRDQELCYTCYSYEHPFGIGYACCGFTPRQESYPVALARKAIAYYLEHERYLVIQDIPEELSKRSAIFVSLYLHEQLRGCIGSIQPSMPTTASEIIHNAVAAACNDPRFPSLTKKELDQCRIKVIQLSQLEPVFFLEDLDPRRYGLLVSASGKHGILLPNLKGIDTAQQQLATALHKANIQADEYFTMERFCVKQYE